MPYSSIYEVQFQNLVEDLFKKVRFDTPDDIDTFCQAVSDLLNGKEISVDANKFKENLTEGYELINEGFSMYVGEGTLDAVSSIQIERTYDSKRTEIPTFTSEEKDSTLRLKQAQQEFKDILIEAIYRKINELSKKTFSEKVKFINDEKMHRQQASVTQKKIQATQHPSIEARTQPGESISGRDVYGLFRSMSLQSGVIEESSLETLTRSKEARSLIENKIVDYLIISGKYIAFNHDIESTREYVKNLFTMSELPETKALFKAKLIKPEELPTLLYNSKGGLIEAMTMIKSLYSLLDTIGNKLIKENVIQAAMIYQIYMSCGMDLEKSQHLLASLTNLYLMEEVQKLLDDQVILPADLTKFIPEKAVQNVKDLTILYNMQETQDLIEKNIIYPMDIFEKYVQNDNNLEATVEELKSLSLRQTFSS